MNYTFLKNGLGMLLLFIVVHATSAQTLIWNPSVKIDDNFHQTPIGTIGKEHFLLSGNIPYHFGVYGPDAVSTGIGKRKIKLIRLDEKMTGITEKYIDFISDINEFITAYVYNGGIHIIYVNKEEKVVKRIFDRNFAETNMYTSSIKGRMKKRSAFTPDTQEYAITFSDDKKRMAISTYQTVEVFDNELKSIDNITLPDIDNVSSILFNNYDLYMVGLAGDYNATTSANLYYLSAGTHQLKTEPVEGVSIKNWNQRIYFDKAANRIHYFSFLADDKSLSRKGFLSDKRAMKMIYKTFSSTLVKEGSYEYPLDHYKNEHPKRPGVYQPEISNVFFSDGVTIAITPHWLEMSNSQKFYHLYTDIYLFKIKDGVLVKEQTLNRSATGEESWYYLYPTIILKGENNYAALYHVGNSAYDLKKVTLDENLNITATETIDTYKQYNYYLALDEYVKIDDNYMIWGRYNKNTGSVVVKME